LSWITTDVKRIPMNTGDEYDALTDWKGYVPWRAGERARIKRRYRRRERRSVEYDMTGAFANDCDMGTCDGCNGALDELDH
jgi:hypothetical protein